MKDLHIALLLLAAVLLVALYAYSKWQERQALKRFRDTLHGEIGDALLQPPAVRPQPLRAAAPAPAVRRIEPHLDVPGAEPDVDRAHGDEGAPSDLNPAAAAAGLVVPGVSSDWVEDPELDCVLELRCAHPVDGVAIFDAAAALGRLDGTLPVFLVVWDGREQQWVPPDRFGFYSELLVAIQLARREARLEPISASHFIAAVQQLAVALEADFDPPDVDRLVGQAADLDRRCGQFDVKIGLTIESRSGPWDAQRLAIAMAACEFTPAEPARWERRQLVEGIDAPLLAAKFDSLLADRLALELDVPVAPAAARPLQALLAAAEQMATALDARVVDDNGRPIDAASVAAIEQQLADLYAQMRDAGLEPGGRRALRLYT
jgi:hypothetical protein